MNNWMNFRRAMGGGNFPYSFGVRKNKFVEEWNGRREMTERAFHVDAKKVPPLLFYCVAFPYFLYSISSTELKHYQGENGREVA